MTPWIVDPLKRAHIANRSWVARHIPEPPPERREGVDPVHSERMKKAWETRRRRVAR